MRESRKDCKKIAGEWRASEQAVHGGEYIPEGTEGKREPGDSTALPPRFDDCIIDRVVIKACGPRCRSC